MDDIRPSSELESTVLLQNQWLIFVLKLIEKSSHNPTCNTPHPPLIFLDQSKFSYIISIIEIDLKIILVSEVNFD